MIQQVDRLFVHCKELLTLADGPATGYRRRGDLAKLGSILDGAIAVRDGLIVATGETGALRSVYRADTELDLSDYVVLPGLVDPHTHPVFVGADEPELAARRAGGGEHRSGRELARVVRGVREATLERLTESTREHLDAFLVEGTTAVEAKTGYGLETEAEIKSARALAAAATSAPLTVHRTFLAAHVLGAEQRAEPEAYLRKVVEEMLPAIRELCDSCDVHVQPDGLNREAARAILTAASEMGLRLRMLADAHPAHGVELGVELGVASVDHAAGLSIAGLERLAASETAAVLLPGAAVDSPSQCAPARTLIDHGCAVALGSDFHPLGSSPRSMAVVMALACGHLGMSPAECVVAATLNAATTLGLDHSLGSLHPGKRADFVALDLPSHAALGDVLGGGPVPLVVVGGAPAVANVQERDPAL